ncbi:D-isomer specific 2-hydroxyacid dehydrogenase family protein [Conexibacter sp. CPCC 206217]|uniref:D-isomer specific 2-hydroxyacid dehydrogenase family protein n=1 Tax=Conexibacter sp. CPCC 206217 TaxID=3064574 RepID=UPI00271B43E7|nr:D-isomer specific 2-hydroxyacid dehydrogenase family protein [Conexibacter sp. CPCC 206217]MDO8210841.1 D-isomer specific 2-hydroxyacid dehydrogenase family protein [Conexibacter sp. CPCC 206217]
MSKLNVFVGPDPRPQMEAAVRDGGGTVVGDPAVADAIVWRGDPQQLAPLLSERVRWVQLPSAGVERWLASGLMDADPQRVWTSATGAYSGIVAEHALALLLAGFRRLPQSARAATWDHTVSGRTLRGATVAIVGAGGIGRALIAMLQPFGAHVLAVTRRGEPVPGADETLPASRVAEVWPRADAVVLAAPATGATQQLVDRAVLAALPTDAWIVNVGRGSLIDTDALVHALAAEQIGGAALDVTDPEPLPDDHPLWHEPRALITPHSANPIGPRSAALADRVRDNVARRIAGDELLGVVERERGY